MTGRRLAASVEHVTQANAAGVLVVGVHDHVTEIRESDVVDLPRDCLREVR